MLKLLDSQHRMRVGRTSTSSTVRFSFELWVQDALTCSNGVSYLKVNNPLRAL